MKRHSPLFLAAAASIWIVSRDAHADDPTRARELFDAGAQAYGVGAFAEAARAFDAAYKASPSPPILFSRSQALRRQYVVDKRRDTLERALAGFVEYLEKMPQGGRRADAAQAIEAIQSTLRGLPASSSSASTDARDKKLATLILSSPTPGATLSIDGRAPTPVPFAGELAPGTHTLVVSAAGYVDTTRDVPLLDGSLVTLDIPLAERPATLHVLTNPGASVLVDGRPSGLSPLPRPLELPSGRHVVTVLRNGRIPVSEEIDLGAGETKTVRRELFPSTQRNVAFSLLLVGGAATITGGVFALLASNRQSAAQGFLDDRASSALPPGRLDDYEAALSARNRWRTAAFATGGAGIGVLLTSAVLFLFDEPSPGSVTTKALPPRPRDPEKRPSQAPLDTALRPRLAPVFEGSYTGLSAIGQF